MTDWIIAIASATTAVAAIGAFVVARRAPRAAAKFADQFRRESVPLEEREKLKTQVLLALLKGRSQLMHQDTIAALNVVDFVFHDEPDVRSSYRLFIEETYAGGADKIIDRYRHLTASVAKSMGLGSTITEADMRLGYYPTALSKIDQAALADAEERIAKHAAQEISKD